MENDEILNRELEYAYDLIHACVSSSLITKDPNAAKEVEDMASLERILESLEIELLSPGSTESKSASPARLVEFAEGTTHRIRAILSNALSSAVKLARSDQLTQVILN